MSPLDPLLARGIKSGSVAACDGAPLSANPFPAESYGGKAWALGWHLGELPWWVRTVGCLLGWVTR